MSVRICLVVALSLVLAACEQEPTTPASPTAIPAVADTPATRTAAALDAPGAPGTDIRDIPDGAVRTATKVDANLPKPVVDSLVRSKDPNDDKQDRITVSWSAVSESEHDTINNYRVVWVYGSFPRSRWCALGGSAYSQTSPFTFDSPAVAGSAFRVWVRARTATSTSTVRRGGPWSDPLTIGRGVDRVPAD